MKPKHIPVPKRIISFGERMNSKRLARLQKARDKRVQRSARRQAKEATTSADEN